MADALQPLADAIAERVWAKSCQGISFGTQRANTEVVRAGSLVSGAWRQSADAQIVAEKIYMLQTSMESSTFGTYEFTARMIGTGSTVRRWARILQENGTSIDGRADLALLNDCLMQFPPDRCGGNKVYFFHAADRIKIGVSENPTRRLACVRWSCPWPVSCDVAVYGGYAHERFLHHAFREYRTHREWFSENPTLSELIRLLRFIDAERPRYK